MAESLHAVCPHCNAVNRIPADRPAPEAHVRRVQSAACSPASRSR